MKTLMHFMAVAALLLAACSSGESEAVLTGDTGEDGDSGFAPSGDAVPEDVVEDDAALITVVVELPSDQLLEGMVIVALEDISYADVSSPELGRVELSVSELRSQGNAVDIFLPVPLDGNVEVNAAVHIDIDMDGVISTGDWISPNIVRVSSFTGLTVSVAVVEV